MKVLELKNTASEINSLNRPNSRLKRKEEQTQLYPNWSKEEKWTEKKNKTERAVETCVTVSHQEARVQEQKRREATTQKLLPNLSEVINLQVETARRAPSKRNTKKSN